MPPLAGPLWQFAYPVAAIAVIVVIAVVARFRPRFGYRTALVVVVVTSVAYLVWRVVGTIPVASVASTMVGVTLLLAEFFVFAQTVMFVVLSWRPPENAHVPLSALGSAPSVDVLIATYNEPIHVLRMTVAGAAGMSYPGAVTVYVCDDGTRDAVRDLASEFGAVFVSRTDHSHAKAGNLNHALSVSHGEFVMVLDADMVPRREFLERTIGRFADPGVGFVQTPQAFYNEDPFQYNLFSGSSLPNEQDFFMRELQGAKARFNGTMFVGSNAVFRRSALESIGGFAVGVITEDMATGMLLQAAKFRGAFVPEVLAAGLAPESVSDMVVQRDRWARGNIQAAKRWNPLTTRGLTPMQRWIYVDGLVYWYFGLFKVVFVATPLLYLILGIPALRTDLLQLAVFWLPFFVASSLCFSIVSEKRRSLLWSHVYELALAPSLAISVLRESIGIKKSAFFVTPKGVVVDHRAFHWRLAIPHLLLIGLSVYGLLAVFVIRPGQLPGESLVISVFWTIYNLAGLVIAVLLCIERPRLRRSERVASGEPITAEFSIAGVQPGELVDVSVRGARVDVPWNDRFDSSSFLIEEPALVSITIPGIGRLPGASRWIRSDEHGLRAGFEFDQITPGQFVALVQFLSSSPGWVRSDRERRALLAPTAARAIAGNVRGLNAALRTSVRVPVSTHGELHTVSDDEVAAGRSRGDHVLHSSRHARGGAAPISYRVLVKDLSHAGCRVSSHRRMQPGEVVALEVQGIFEAPQPAQVRWVRRRHGRWEAGLQFDAVAGGRSR